MQLNVFGRNCGQHEDLFIVGRGASHSAVFAVQCSMALLPCFPKESSAERPARLRRRSFIGNNSWNPALWVFLICLLSIGSAGWSQEAADHSHAGLAGTLDGTQPGMQLGTQLGLTADSSSALPEAPGTAQANTRDATGQPAANKTAASAAPDERAPQTKRILGVLPNFRSVSTDQILPPQSVKEKFLTATDDSFDYSSVFIPMALAGYSLESNATPEFGQGWVGYGRYFWHAAVDQTSENYMVEFVVPALTREDTRFYTLGRGGFLKRAGYALSRAVVTRSDSGREVFNLSEVVGAGAASGLSSLYYPSRERSLSNTGSEWGLDVGIDALSFVAKEFWPDINRHLTRGSRATNLPGR